MQITYKPLTVFGVFAARAAQQSVWLLVLMILTGCGGGRPATLSGQATYGGEAIAEGKLRLFPLEPLETAGAELAIQNGAFAAGNGAGLLAGRYRVEIRASHVVEGVEVIDIGPDPEPLRIDYVPEQYNNQSTLEITLLPGANQHDFNLAGDADWQQRLEQQLAPEIRQALRKGN